MIRSEHLIAQIDLRAIAHNIRILRCAAGGMKVCAAVKANAYGHGVGVVLPAMVEAGVEMLGVATIGEAAELRDLGWTGGILLFGSELSVYSGPKKAELSDWLVENEVSVTVVQAMDADALTAAASRVSKPAHIHLKLDTGMSRMGVDESTLLALIDGYGQDPSVVLEGLYTHLATADEADKAFAKEQLARFADFCGAIAERGIHIPLIHASNSAACLDLPSDRFTMIRPGISVYGAHTSPQMANRPDLRLAMRLISYLTLVKRISAKSYVGYGRTFQADRDMIAGLVPIGYADGYNRLLSNKAQMLVHGQPVRVVGRISMDQTVVDLTGLTDNSVAAGTEIVVMDNDRNSPNTAEHLAALVGTIPYEIMTSVGARVQRVAV